MPSSTLSWRRSPPASQSSTNGQSPIPSAWSTPPCRLTLRSAPGGTPASARSGDPPLRKESRHSWRSASTSRAMLKIGSDTIWAKSRARPAPDAILDSGPLRLGEFGSDFDGRDLKVCCNVQHFLRTRSKGAINERRTSGTEELRDAPARGDQRRAFSHRRRRRAIRSLLRKGLRRSHSDDGRRQRTSLPSAREYLDDSQRWGRADPG